MKTTLNTARLGTALVGNTLAAALALGLAATMPTPASAQAPVAVAPADTINLSVGKGSMVRLDSPMSDLFVADSAIADVQVRSSTQLYIFGKTSGETTIYATDRKGRVVYSVNVRVGKNLTTIDDVLRVAMPDANITVTPMNGVVVLTGTVPAADDLELVRKIAQDLVGEGTDVVLRLSTATPLQVNLQVKIAEVSRSVTRDIGLNFATNDPTGGFSFGIGRGNPGTINPGGGGTFDITGVGTTLGFAQKLLGLDVLATLNLLESQGLVTTLANPNLTALSGETASFLAGGEFPVPIAQALGTTSIEFKSYGVNLSFSPIVLANGRISMRVAPEVSELSSQGAIRINGTTVPATTTRRTETTVILGSGQSLMIGGLLRNINNNTIEKTPFLGNLPILGALFRSAGFRREETELVIVVTPYLVKPVSADRIVLPTDGYRSPLEADRILRGQFSDGVTGEKRPGPTVGPSRAVQQPVGRPAPSASPNRPSAASGTAKPGFKL